MKMAPAIAMAFLMALWAAAVQAGGPVDPDWPCVQRRQPKLSLGQVWTGPQPDAAITARAKDPEIVQLASLLALRRTALDLAETEITRFAQSASPQDLQALFLATFEQIQIARDRVMAGITRYAHGQEALEKKIAVDRDSFNRLMAADPKDFDAIDKAEADVDWATRIFQDRQQSLTYICETPVILEKRAFALGRMVLQQLPK